MCTAGFPCARPDSRVHGRIPVCTAGFPCAWPDSRVHGRIPVCTAEFPCAPPNSRAPRWFHRRITAVHRFRVAAKTSSRVQRLPARTCRPSARTCRLRARTSRPPAPRCALPVPPCDAPDSPVHADGRPAHRRRTVPAAESVRAAASAVGGASRREINGLNGLACPDARVTDMRAVAHGFSRGKADPPFNREPASAGDRADQTFCPSLSPAEAGLKNEGGGVFPTAEAVGYGSHDRYAVIVVVRVDVTNELRPPFNALAPFLRSGHRTAIRGAAPLMPSLTPDTGTGTPAGTRGCRRRAAATRPRPG